jgi:competence protein ComEC
VKARPPPVVYLAIGFGFGVSLPLLQWTPPLSLQILLLLAVLIRTWPRPGAGVWVLLTLPLGTLSADAALRSAEGDCRQELADGAAVAVTGWFEARPGRGTAPFRVVGGMGCQTVLRAVLASDDLDLRTGERVRARGEWRRSKRAGVDPGRRGVLLLRSAERWDGASTGPGASTRTRARIEEKVQRLFPSEWPLVDAIVLAGTASLDRELRDRFAAAGVVHLLAISGFHVGVVAGLVLALLALAGVPPRSAHLIGAGAAWVYVAFLGFPSAATRAGLLIAGLALVRLRGAPASGLGLLSTAFLGLLVADPLRLAQIGFQLSFAGALGLTLGAATLATYLARRRLPRAAASTVAAGVAATLLTLPLVAVHFGRVSLIGIPMTVLLSPLFALAIPWTIVALALEPLWGGGAAFIARAAEGVLIAVRVVVDWAGPKPWAATEVGLPLLLALAGGAAAGWSLVRRRGAMRASVRVTVLALATAAALLVVPIGQRLTQAGRLEVIMLDVGQGDAILVRTPANRWVLIDAGPSGRGFDAGARTVIPFLKRRGVDRIAVLFLTHADLDHVGGAAAVLSTLAVGSVVDPGFPSATATYVEVLRTAARAAVPWTVARRGMTWTLDGVTLRALTPLPPAPESSMDPSATRVEGTETNAASLVLMLEYGDFSLLLTGDAPQDVESRLLRDGALTDIDVLKVGHHGSGTSTSWDLLSRITPELALISVGRRNRYGHPHPSVLRRLQRAGVETERTDLSGGIRVRAGADGAWSVDVGLMR